MMKIREQPPGVPHKNSSGDEARADLLSGDALTFSPEEKKAGLEVIRRVDPLLEDIIWEEWLRSRTNAFIKPREVYSEEDSQQIEPQAVQRISRERARIKELKRKWRRDENKEYADFTERMVVVFGAKLRWLGKATTFKQTDEIDDINRATDFSGHFKRLISEDIIQQSAGFDTTDKARFATQKVSNALRFINYGVLGELLIAESSSEETGKDLKGRQHLLPHFVFVVSQKRAAEIARLTEEAFSVNDWTKLALHPLQIELLEQAFEQAKAYRAYAENISVHDYKRSPIKKISTRIARDLQSRRKVLRILDRCVILFENILNERKALIKQHAESGTEEIRSFLASIKPDQEHARFVQLFNKQGKGQFDRFRAFLTVMPPVKFNPETGTKTPIKVKTNAGEEELKSRFTNLMRTKEEDNGKPL